jgi:hypothetical protein
MAILAACIVGVALAVHAWQAIRTASYVDFVTGVWLTLADDLARGVFYRELAGPDGYGGTRYFPLFFTSIGALMRLGVAPLAAGFAVSLAAGVLLVLGIRRFLARLGLPGAMALTLGLFIFAPRFAQQALLAIRSDILAAAFAVWGLALTLPALDEEQPRGRPIPAAALLFVLAAATKVTSLYAPAAAVIALAWSGRVKTSIRLGAMVAAGLAAVIAVVALASRGRAIESWQACALAGGGLAEWARGLGSALFSQIIGPSRVFGTVLLAGAVAWVVLLRAPATKLALALFPAALGATIVVLASPGTSYTNQLIDLFVASLLLVGWALVRHPGWRTPASVLLVVLSLAAARQSARAVWDHDLRDQARQLSAERASLAATLASAESPVLSESPELLIAARQRPYLLDPFALRVVTLRRPDVLRDVTSKLDARFFSRVVLMFDPESPGGKGWYTNMDLGWPIVSRILANYEPVSATGGFRVYGPRGTTRAPGESVSVPRTGPRTEAKGPLR